MVVHGRWMWLVWCMITWNGADQSNADAEAGNLYSSLAHMEDLFILDEHIGNLLLLLPEHLPAVSSYLETYTSVVVDKARGMEVTGHPVHVYALIKRLVLHWPRIAPALDAHVKMGEGGCEDKSPNCETWALTNECILSRTYMIHNCPRACHACPDPEVVSLAGEVLDRLDVMVLPSQGDLDGAALALSRLQQVYRIPVGAFMAGTIAGTSSAIKLNLEDCIRVGNVTLDHGIYSYAITWYRYCLALVDHTHLHAHRILQDAIEHAEKEHNSKWRADDANFFHSPVSPDVRQAPKNHLFGEVCRGIHTPVPEAWRLQCYVDHRGSASLLLRPVKYEQLHHNPELYIFYNIISDVEMNVIKNLSRALLHRSAVVDHNPNNKTIHLSQARISHTAWLANSSHSFLATIAQRIADTTRLFVFEGTEHNMAGEKLQVLNYGIGGHYSMHLDLLFKYRTEEELSECYPVIKEGCDLSKFAPGDRLATWMFYLSDVKAGGHTGFPYAGISVAPVKGSAVFWYNLKSNGFVNTQSHHGGCPVLLGHKWAANKWIRENVNFLRRPCINNQ